MTGPVLTAGMASLRDAFDRRFPNRSKVSDGWIGDNAHRKTRSSHNPDDTPGELPEWDGDADRRREVRALDVTADLRDPHGVTMQDTIDFLREQHWLSAAIEYMIYDRFIYIQPDFLPIPFDGDPHLEHAHFTGRFSDAADARYFAWHFEQIGDDDVLTSEQITAAAAAGVQSLLWQAVHAIRHDDAYEQADENTQRAWRNTRDLIAEVVREGMK
jgi:hypothetical protein